GDEGPSVKVVIGALLEIEHAQQADHDEDARRDAEHHIGHLQPARRADRQHLSDEDQLDHQRGKQCEGGDVVQEGEQRGHPYAPGWHPVAKSNHTLATWLLESSTMCKVEPILAYTVAYPAGL